MKCYTNSVWQHLHETSPPPASPQNTKPKVQSVKPTVQSVKSVPSQWTGLPGRKELPCRDWRCKWAESCSSSDSAPTERQARLPCPPAKCKERGFGGLKTQLPSAAAPSELAEGGTSVMQRLEHDCLLPADGSENTHFPLLLSWLHLCLVSNHFLVLDFSGFILQSMENRAPL